MSAMERDRTGKMPDRAVREVALRQKPEGAEGVGLWLSAVWSVFGVLEEKQGGQWDWNREGICRKWGGVRTRQIIHRIKMSAEITSWALLLWLPESSVLSCTQPFTVLWIDCTHSAFCAFSGYLGWLLFTHQVKLNPSLPWKASLTLTRQAPTPSGDLDALYTARSCPSSNPMF